MLEEQQRATTITEVYNTCNPEGALQPDDYRFVELKGGRGLKLNVAQTIAKRIQSKKYPHWHKQLLTGHRGSGKSTILLQVDRILSDSGYFPVYLDVQDVLDLGDIQYTDVLLSMAEAVIKKAEGCKDIVADASLLDRLRDVLEVDEILKETTSQKDAAVSAEAGAQAGFKGFLSFFGRVTTEFRRGTSTRESLRKKVEPRMSHFLDAFNNLLDDLQTQLSQIGNHGLVVIVDGLEKMHYRNADDGETNQRILFVRHAEQLKSPHAHLVYTVPIALHGNNNLLASFDSEWQIPMVRIHGPPPKDGDDEEGLAALEQVLRQRIDVDAIFEELEDLRRLARASGGCLRDLMHLVQYACDAAEKTIQPDHVDYAIQELRRVYSRLLKETDLDTLVRIYQEKDVANDDVTSRLLHERLVLQYSNGEDWYDVHPMVQQTKRFREALEAHAGQA